MKPQYKKWRFLRQCSEVNRIERSEAFLFLADSLYINNSPRGLYDKFYSTFMWWKYLQYSGRRYYVWMFRVFFLIDCCGCMLLDNIVNVGIFFAVYSTKFIAMHTYFSMKWVYSYSLSNVYSSSPSQIIIIANDERCVHWTWHIDNLIRLMYHIQYDRITVSRYRSSPNQYRWCFGNQTCINFDNVLYVWMIILPSKCWPSIKMILLKKSGKQSTTPSNIGHVSSILLDKLMKYDFVFHIGSVNDAKQGAFIMRKILHCVMWNDVTMPTRWLEEIP